MIHSLTNTLKAILDDTSLPALVCNADVAFERPAETYNPSTPTINLFLYDVRENTELRSNEPVIERLNGVATIRRPPLRVACSYQVTAWIESGVTGEQAILDQHQLLGEVLKVLSRMPTIEEKYLQGELKNTLYPVSLVTAQADLMRNPAEFWTAMGGKLRPSFTITATIAMDQEVEPVQEHLVSSKQVTLGEKLAEKAEYKDKEETETLYEIAGIVTNNTTGTLLEKVEITLIETGGHAITDLAGRYRFIGLAKGEYNVNVVKSGYSTVTQAIQVPGNSPTSFDIKLSPI